mmetsp:Transcript_33369/g.76161  ORF Transcript_33369/g.76161 Transcript_33369/m.76161 type:complete len:699 (-) Transcript_33369:46-2142(-)
MEGIAPVSKATGEGDARAVTANVTLAELKSWMASELDLRQERHEKYLLLQHQHLQTAFEERFQAIITRLEDLGCVTVEDLDEKDYACRHPAQAPVLATGSQVNGGVIEPVDSHSRWEVTDHSVVASEDVPLTPLFTHKSNGEAAETESYDAAVESRVLHAQKRMEGATVSAPLSGFEEFHVSHDSPVGVPKNKGGASDHHHGRGFFKEVFDKRRTNAKKNEKMQSNIKKDVRILKGRSSSEDLEDTNGTKPKKRCRVFERFVVYQLDPIIGVLIVTNTIIMFLQLEWEGRRTAVRETFYSDSSVPDQQWIEEAFAITEHVFAWVYLSELIMRLIHMRVAYFLEKTNYLDIFVVAVNFIDLYILTAVASGSGGDLAVVKVLRLARLARTVRFVRVLKIWPALRVLVNTIARSIGSLIWSMVILGVFGLVGAMILCQASQDFIKDRSSNFETRQEVNAMYGTSTKAVWTMFELTMSGCWPNYASILITEVSPLFAVFFALYVSVVVFAVIRIITALFLKDTLQVASQDAESVWQAKVKSKNENTARLVAFFMAADGNGDGKLTKEEFKELVSKDQARAYLAALDVEVHEAGELFTLLDDDGTGEITYTHFVDSVLKLRGPARSQDIVALTREFKRINQKLEKVEQQTQQALQRQVNSTAPKLRKPPPVHHAHGASAMSNASSLTHEARRGESGDTSILEI